MARNNIALSSLKKDRCAQIYKKEKELIPSMNQNIEPHGIARSSRDSKNAFRAFSKGQIFNGGNKETDGWVEYESSALMNVSKVRVDISRRAPDSNVYRISLRDFSILGSVDGEEFEEIYSQTVEPTGTEGVLIINLKETYQFKVFRLNIRSSVSGVGGATRNFIVNEFQLIKDSELFHVYDTMVPADKSNSSIHIPDHFEEKIYTKRNFSTKENLKVFSQNLSKNNLTKITTIY